MKKEAQIFIHQLNNAINQKKKLQDIWRELSDYPEEDRMNTVEDLDKYRQELITTGDSHMATMLDELVTNIRIGIAPDRPKIGPKEF